MKDFLGNEFEVGDFVVWAVTQRRSTAMRKGTVTALADISGKPTIKVDIQEKKYDRIENEWVPSIRKGSISTPSHAVIISKARTMTDKDWKVTYEG